MKLALLPDLLAVCRLEADTALPSWATSSSLFSISRIGDELSIVCPETQVPEGIKIERGWRCIKVIGTLDFALVGILNSLTSPLAQAGISIFAISTFDTDYLLVKADKLDSAVSALKTAGNVFESH